MSNILKYQNPSSPLLKPWKALEKMKYEAIPDSTFTRDKTGIGSIEYFSADNNNGITYLNGYHKTHPKPGTDVILYDPATNDQQDVRLDALHFMPKDPIYGALYDEYLLAARDGDVAYNADKLLQEYIDSDKLEQAFKTYDVKNISELRERLFLNEADGLLRNMFIEGTPEYIKSKRYYPDKTQLEQWNVHLMPYINNIKTYLETGVKPEHVIEPAVIIAYKKGGRIHIKKKNRGKFTEYCGGKVTEECIARGKRSKNPLTRRRANFASVVRKWKHENGGILKAQNSAKLSNGYVQYNGSDLSDIETFNKNWLNYRNSQLANQGWKDESIKNKLNWFQRNFGASDKTVANLVREQLFSNLDNTKELSFSDALKDSQGRYLLTESMYADFPGERKLHEVEVGPPKPIEDWKLDYSFNGSVGGTHYPDFNTIIYNDLYQNTPIKIHERDHAMFGKYNDKNIGLRIVENIFKQDFLDNVSDKWGYYDDPEEIRARLMQMRYNNQLDPKHKYTFEEIENMRNSPTFIDEHIFDRYTNKYIEYLLNDVAQNNVNKSKIDYRNPINFVKDGGILKALDYANYITKKPAY